MKRFLIPSLVVVLALLVAVPSFALEVKYGGLFRARVLSQADFTGTTTADGDWGYGALNSASTNTLSMLNPQGASQLPSNPNNKSIPYTQHNNRFDQRLRIFIDFISSENLKIVTRFEANSVWGNFSPANGYYGGGTPGSREQNFVVRDAFLDFNIPGTPLNSKVGIQMTTLLDSWIIDTDLAAATLTANLKPFSVTLGYASGQNFNYTQEADNVDDLIAAVGYKEGPFGASLMGVWQDAHNTPASVFPTIGALFDDPIHTNVPYSPSPQDSVGSFIAQINPVTGVVSASTFIPTPQGIAVANPWTTGPNDAYIFAQNNQLFDLGLQLTYKLDFLQAYLNFVKNFGSVKLGVSPTANNNNTNTFNTTFTANYTGWMVDAGANYFCGPFTVNLGGFYTSGEQLTTVPKNFATPNVDHTVTAANPQIIQRNNNNINEFTYPLTTSKYFSEIMGGGILDNFAPNGGYWRGYPDPTNIWTVTLGGAWQVLPQTKLSLSWWYFGTSQSVPSRYNVDTGRWSFSSSLGNEIDMYVTQNIVDRLNLDLVFAWFIQGDAFRAKSYGGTGTLANPVVSYVNDSPTYELGARLQWAF